MKPIGALVMASWLAACGVEFSEPLVDTAADVGAAVALTDSAPLGEARVSAVFWPGFDAAGRVRTMVDSSLSIMGRLIGPYRGYTTDGGSDVLYAETWAVDPDAPIGPVELRGPAIEGLGEDPPLLRLTPPWRVGPASVAVVPGAALRLELATAAEPADSVYERWRLDVRKDGRSVAQLSAEGIVPPAIEVSWALLAGLADRGEVQLTVYQGVTTPTAGRRYHARLLLTTKHVWFVTVEP